MIEALVRDLRNPPSPILGKADFILLTGGLVSRRGTLERHSPSYSHVQKFIHTLRQEVGGYRGRTLLPHIPVFIVPNHSDVRSQPLRDGYRDLFGREIVLPWEGSGRVGERSFSCSFRAGGLQIGVVGLDVSSERDVSAQFEDHMRIWREDHEGDFKLSHDMTLLLQHAPQQDKVLFEIFVEPYFDILAFGTTPSHGDPKRDRLGTHFYYGSGSHSGPSPNEVVATMRSMQGDPSGQANYIKYLQRPFDPVVRDFLVDTYGDLLPRTCGRQAHLYSPRLCSWLDKTRGFMWGHATCTDGDLQIRTWARKFILDNNGARFVHPETLSYREDEGCISNIQQSQR